MNKRRFLNTALSLLIAAVFLFGTSGSILAQPMNAPASPVDETKVPHYFGPYPNWANSPFTLPDATVTINGDGAGATAVASVGALGAVTGITITDPGSGYTSATVDITSATGTGAMAVAAVNTSGAVTSVNVDAGGSGYTAPTVSFSGGGGQGTMMQVGNALIERAFATDFEPFSPVRVLVVVPASLPDGTLTEFLTLNQATSGGSPTPSAGEIFNAYVLRPTGVANEYSVIFDSGTLTVPMLTDMAVSEQAAFPVGPVAVQAGDVIAFYGAGIPVDIDPAGADIFSYPAPAAPAAGNTIILGSPEFPIYPQARTYSFAANVIDTSAVPPLVDATAKAYGGVDAVTLDLNGAGSGYTFPTVDFDMPDAPDGVQASAHAEYDLTTGVITAVVVDNPGSGYSAPPNVVIRDGTLFDPILNGGSGASATATLSITSIVVDTFGSGYSSAPIVTINDPTGVGASATAVVNAGAVTGITVTAPGSDYVTQGGIKKFQDGLPVLCIPAAGQTFADCTDNNLGQHLPIAVPDTETFTVANGFALDADYYVIALVQHREQMHSDLPPTLLREYVQLETPANASFSKHVALVNENLDPNVPAAPIYYPGTTDQVYAVDDPHFLGPVIVATKDKPVRIVFYNLLPNDQGGDLFLPTDSTIMGSGMGPMDMMPPVVEDNTVMDGVRNPECSDTFPKSYNCFKDNRATLHLHGGITPWISDGTPHQWITPANENTPWPQGVSVEAVPDMINVPGVPNCSDPVDGCMDFYYTNQQSARFMFYHDHAWGITRLNVYAGEAAGYVITDDTEATLMAAGGALADVGLGIPLVIQDRTFVPGPEQVAAQDPTWDYSRWGGEGNFWYHHVYMPAQNPGDPSGMSAFGRWMYGPWFWPPATPPHGPIPNPYYNMDPATGFTTPLAVPCSLDDPATWQYDSDPFCEPELIPGTPNISVGMEQFNDTPIVNGTAYPTTNVDPKAYRFRILNAANDRFWNLQWYVADPTTGTDSEVALNPAELAAAQIDPNIFPTPDTSLSPAGPSWIQIGTEGGFLPAPVVVPNQPITWIIDPTRFDVGNVDLHSLLLAPAERADVIVDFSQYAGQTLILYNDAPAAFPARVSSYDYYTGAPDLSPVGAPSILPGYGPNTRTIMQVKVAATTPATAYDVPGTSNDGLGRLQAAFRHHADGSGVFESGQHPIIVGQAAYNSAYGTSFASAGDCTSATATNKCDGFARINQQGGDMFNFDTLNGALSGSWEKLSIPLEPKAIHDEMNASSFDEFGRMTANLGLEAVPATPAGQNITLYPYVNPQTELIDATNLPMNDISMTPITAINSADGTQIWKITHNGVDTHPIHWHLYDVQTLNRVTWDNIIIPPDATELGWKDTLRISPLEDTIVALRPIIPYVPFELPNSARPLNPMMPIDSQLGFYNIDANGNPTNPIINSIVNFGWEYVYHCHILSHEEMDMMRPVSVAMPPNPADRLAFTTSGNGNNATLTLTWYDNSINETTFLIQRSDDGGGTWADLGTVDQPLHQTDPAVDKGMRSYIDTTYRRNAGTYLYRVVAQNTIGYGGQFMSLTVKSAASAPMAAIEAPTNLTAALQAGPQVSLTWMDNATNETGFVVERSTDGVNFTQIGTAPARNNTGNVTFVDNAVTVGSSYTYRVAAVNAVGSSNYSNLVSIAVAAPNAPTLLSAMTVRQGNNNRVTLTWTDTANESGYTIQRATNAAFTTGLVNSTAGANVTTTTVTVPRGTAGVTTYYFRIIANNVIGSSPPSNVLSIVTQ